MIEAVARARLESMLQWTVVPLLTAAEVTQLLTLSRTSDVAGNVPLDTWAASTRYRADEARVPTLDNGFYFTVTAGVSGAVEPVWPETPGLTVVDGTVTWTNAGAYLWLGAWNLNRGAAEGWRWKAGKVAAEYDVELVGSVDATRSQIYKHCLEQAARFGGNNAGVVWFPSPAQAAEVNP